MAAIFLLSATPGADLMRSAGPMIKQAPQTITPPIGRKKIQIEWLKVGHFVGYASLGAALLYGFDPFAKFAAGKSIAITILYAITDEIHQTFVPGRHAGLNDVVLDVGAAALIILLCELIRYAKQGIQSG